jgi:glutamate:GABA antiporter
MHSSRKPNRVLSVFGLVMINVIAIDSLRNLPTNAAAGLSIVSFYLLGAILFLLPCTLITAELATHYPKTGGVYVWVREAFGKRWAFVTIWLQWIYNVVWYPTILLFIATNIAYLINPALAHNKLYLVSMVVGLFFLATVLNNRGMQTSSRVSTASALLGTLVPMLILIALGADWIFSGKPVTVNFHFNHWLPHLHGNNNLAFLGVVMFSMMGLEMSAVHAQEVKSPKRDYPRALVISATLITISLILATLAIVVIVPHHALNIVSGLDQALSILLSQVHWHWLFPVVIIMIILGGFGGMSAWVVGPTKALMVAAKDGSLPNLLQRSNKHGAPSGALWVQFVLVLIITGIYILFQSLSTAYWILSDMTAELALLFYILFFAAAIRLRYKTAKQANSYRIPGGKNSGIWIAGVIGIAVCSVIMVLGFIPPAQIKTGSLLGYESILIGGIIILSVIPLLIYRHQQRQQR